VKLTTRLHLVSRIRIDETIATRYKCFWPGYLIKHKENFIYYLLSGPGSTVGIATDYGLDGLEIEYRWGQDFLHLSIPVLEPT
jgi:hypothetical protein